MNARIAGNVPDENGHISVMISYVTYRRVLAFLAAIKSPLEPDKLISSIVEGWVRSLNLNSQALPVHMPHQKETCEED